MRGFFSGALPKNTPGLAYATATFVNLLGSAKTALLKISSVKTERGPTALANVVVNMAGPTQPGAFTVYPQSLDAMTHTAAAFSGSEQSGKSLHCPVQRNLFRILLVSQHSLHSLLPGLIPALKERLIVIHDCCRHHQHSCSSYK
jgi:hypothetical protein